MGINLGGAIGSLYLGSTKIKEAYLGSVKVFGSSISLPAKTIRFKFSDTSYQPTTGSNESDTSSIGTWTAVNASEGIWDWYYNSNSWGGNDRKFNLNTLNINGTVEILAGNLAGVTSTFRLFWGTNALKNNGLTSVAGIYNTTSLTDIGSMFEYCTNIRSLEAFDTRNVTSCRYAFARLYYLTTFPLFNFSNCVDFTAAMKECHVLTHVPALDFSSCNAANDLFLNDYVIDNGKHLFNEICMSPAGLNGNYNTKTFSNAGRDSQNDQRSRIPEIIGGTLAGVVVETESANLGSAYFYYDKTIHPGYYITARTSRPTHGTGSVSITNNTTVNKINMNNVSGSTSSSVASRTVSTNAYLGYDYSHTNTIRIRFDNSGGASGYSTSIYYSMTKYEYDLLD